MKYGKLVRDVVCGGMLALLAEPVLAQTDDAARTIMADVFDALAYLLPLSVRGGEEASAWDRELIDAKLSVLEHASTALVEHGRTRDLEFGLLARSFERTVTDMRTAFADEWPQYAYFLMTDLTQYCAACHARLPSASRTDFGQRLLARIGVDAFEPAALAALYVATRQFDGALRTYERMLLDPEVHPIDADVEGGFGDYLQIAIVVTQDVARASAFLAQVAARDDMPYYLHRRLGLWREAMADLGDDLTGPATLARARALFAQATAMIRPIPASHTQAVHDYVAASLFRRLLAESSRALTAEERAEIYYCLGVIALRTAEPNVAVPDMELLLEASIRESPHGPNATDAYALLEEFGFTNSTHLLLIEDNDGRAPVIDLPALHQLIQ